MDIIEAKKDMKKRKPVFTRQDNHKKSMAAGWRKPKGCHSKMRHNIKGYKRNVSTGYGTPDLLRHASSEGKKILAVSTIEDISKLPKDCTVIISRTVGKRKRQLLLEELKKKKLTLYQASIEKEEEKLAAAKKEREAKKEAKKEAPVEKQHKKKEDKGTDKDASDEEKKQQAKKEMDKALIHTE